MLVGRVRRPPWVINLRVDESFIEKCFHTYDYARHFVNACTRILGLEGTLEGVVDHGKLIKVAVFPIGIDSNRFIQALKLSDVQNFITDLRAKFGERKLVLGVDRLDMVKGILQKMLAFEKFLEENPKWHHKVVLLQISVPTRTDVPEYQKFTRQVHELVGRINGKFGTLSHAPIHHLDQSLDFHTLCAMYAVTDVALVTSLRDGMNLVSYEFVACQASKKGVLILSEFAGSAQSLGAGAILVNPWNIEQVASSIAYALNMPSEEREKKHQLNYNHVTSHTAQEWAKLFVSELNGTVVEAPLRPGQVRARQSLPDIAVEQYVQSDNRLLILGFNATLTQSTECPSTRSDQIIDMKPKLVSDLHGLLRRIGSDPKTTIIVLSGSDRNVLDDNFGSYNMWLAAENGIFLRHTTGSWMTTMPECSSIEVVHSVKHVFEYFTKRTPHSYFEQRETSLLWNYKYADAEFGKLQARNFLLHLCTSPICSSDVYILEGERSVEVRARGVTKGATIGRILPEIFHSRRSMVAPINYVLCIGHFLEKDEDIYSFFESEPPVPVRTAPPNVRSAQVKSDKSGAHCEIGMCSAMEKVVTVVDLKKESYFSCAVGRERTSARYVLRSSENVVSLLKKLAEVSLPSQ